MRSPGAATIPVGGSAGAASELAVVEHVKRPEEPFVARIQELPNDTLTIGTRAAMAGAGHTGEGRARSVASGDGVNDTRGVGATAISVGIDAGRGSAVTVGLGVWLPQAATAAARSAMSPGNSALPMRSLPRVAALFMRPSGPRRAVFHRTSATCGRSGRIKCPSVFQARPHPAARPAQDCPCRDMAATDPRGDLDTGRAVRGHDEGDAVGGPEVPEGGR